MLDLNKLREEQLKLSKKVIISDSFEKLELIGGVDFGYFNNEVVCSIAVCNKAMKQIEIKHSIKKSSLPYIVGFIAYRVGPPVSDAFSKLENKPDLLIFSGNGILHPRRIGLASHMGIILDCPTIGIAKQLLTGEEKGDVIYVDKEARAEKIVTRAHAKPLFVSPGHKIGLKTSVELVKKYTLFPHKMPEPLHLAHKNVKEILKKNQK